MKPATYVKPSLNKHLIFVFRILGLTTLGLITVLALKARRFPLPGNARLAATALMAMGWTQVQIYFYLIRIELIEIETDLNF